MELNSIQNIEDATKFGRREMFRIGTALLFIVMIMLYASTIDVIGRPFSIELVIAAMIGGYMAMNIGANNWGQSKITYRDVQILRTVSVILL